MPKATSKPKTARKPKEVRSTIPGGNPNTEPEPGTPATVSAAPGLQPGEDGSILTPALHPPA